MKVVAVEPVLGRDDDPRAVVGPTRPDAVAGDARPPSLVGASQVRVTLLGPAPRARRFCGWPGGRGWWCRHDVRPGASALGVDCGHTVVSGGAGGEAGVQVGDGRADRYERPA